MSQDNNKHRTELLGALSSISQIGITIIVCVAAGIFIGRALDSKLSSSPWMTLIFIFIGVGAAFKSIIDYAKREQAKDKQQDKRHDSRQGVYDQMDAYDRTDARDRTEAHDRTDK